MMQPLLTERLHLRMFRESDIDAYAAMCADPEVMRYLGGAPLSRAEAWRHMAMIIGHWELRGYGLWAVEERSTGALLGRVGCWMPEGWPGLEVGWMLRRASWGYGFACEAAQASIRYAFEALNAPRIISIIDPENTRSIRLAERLGERQEGEIELFSRRVAIYSLPQTLPGTGEAHD